MNNFDAYLRDQVTEDGEAPSHTSMVGGKWFIPKADDDRFFDLYLAALDAGDTFYFSERILPGRLLNFFLDIDFPDQGTLEAIVQHNNLHTFETFYALFVEVATTVVQGRTDNNVRHVFSRKRQAYHKFHVNFPTFSCTVQDARSTIAQIRTRFLVEFNIDTCPVLAHVNWAKIFDTAPYSGGLRMPGSSKDHRDASFYEIFDLEENIFVPLTNVLLQDTSIRTEALCPNQHAAPLAQYEIDEGIPYAEISAYVAHLRNTGVFGNNLPLSIFRIERPLGLSFVVKLNDRWCPYKGNYHRRTSRVLYLVITQRGTFLKCYDEACCTMQNLPRQPLTAEMERQFAGVAAISLEISPREEKCLEEFGIRLQLTAEVRRMMTPLSNVDADIGQVFEAVFRHKFCAVEAGKDKKAFLVFSGHIFKPGNDAALMALIFVIAPLYRLFVHEMYPDTFRRKDLPAAGNQVVEGNEDGNVIEGDDIEDGEVEEDEGEGEDEDADGEVDEICQKKIKAARIKAVNSIIRKLGGKTSTQILSKASTFFFHSDPNVAVKMDAARHLMAFRNGVLDFTDPNSPVFRDGRYDDYLSISTSTVFQHLSFDDPKVLQVQAFMKSLFPDFTIREYVWKTLSKCLTAAEMERLYILTGSGSNGKSKLVKLISKAFGEYWRDMSVSVMTQKRKSSNAASPELVDTKGRTIITLQEPETNTRMNAGYVI